MASTSVAIPVAPSSIELQQELEERLADVQHIVRVESELDGNVFRAVMFVDEYENAPHHAVFQIEKELWTKHSTVDFDFRILAATQDETERWFGR